MYIRSIRLRREEIDDWEEYPFCLPAVSSLYELAFTAPVTAIVGENGSGKSTLLEAIAIACGFNPEGGSRNFSFATAQSHSGLHRHIAVIREPKRAPDGYFLRAESFYNVASYVDELDRIPSTARLVRDSYGGKSLHEQSHGEAFLSLLLHRIQGPGLYLLDEPEAALSPTRQMALLARMHQLVGRGSQIILATHSPILLSYPDAQLLEISPNGLLSTEYEQTDHYLVMRGFLNNYKKLQAELFSRE